jgi:predicted RNA-binding protein YlxR (DUF448 family)
MSARLEATLDAGPRHVTPGAERFCAATGKVRPVADMIRFVVAPDGAAVPDLKRRLPGRGIWITGTRQALSIAVARKAFSRGFRREVRISPDFVAATERLIEIAALDALAVARKGGWVASGFAKVEAALAAETVAALLHAAEAAPDGMRKLCPHGAADNVIVIRSFTSAQLDLALGRANVIHAALLAGPQSETFLARVARLERFRTGGSGGGFGHGGPGGGSRESGL